MLNPERLLPGLQKRTNDRTLAFLGVLVLLIVAAMPTTAGSVAGEGPDPIAGTFALSADQSEWANAVARTRGSDLRRLLRLHAALLDAEDPSADPEFVLRFVALAREVGISAYFVAVDAPDRDAIRSSHLAAGIGHFGQIVVFDGQRVSRPDFGRLRLLDDRSAAALLVGEVGLARLARGDTQGASEQFEIALGLDPELAWAWSGLGEVLRRNGEIERALDAYEKSLEIAAVRPW